MNNKSFKFPDTAAYEFVIQALKDRGVTYEDIAQMAYNLQKKFVPDIQMDEVKKKTPSTCCTNEKFSTMPWLDSNLTVWQLRAKSKNRWKVSS